MNAQPECRIGDNITDKEGGRGGEREERGERKRNCHPYPHPEPQDQRNTTQPTLFSLDGVVLFICFSHDLVSVG